MLNVHGDAARRTRRIALATAAGAAAATVLVPSMASASSDAKSQHCVGRAVSSPSEVSTTTCYSTFAEAIYAATGGSVQLPAGATTVSDAAIERSNLNRTAQAVVVGISYWNTGGQGSTFTHEASSGCDNDAGREWYFQFPSSWNDKAGSARAYTNCVGRYWENGNGTNGSGANINTYWSGGAMNDKATFIEWW